MCIRAPQPLLIPCALAVLSLAGCSNRPSSNRIDYEMGERITVGPLTYNVVESAWRSQLGTELKPRLPQHRFLLITVSVTNGGGREVALPLFQMENSNNETFPESDDGEGVENWFGILRSLTPAGTQQGRLLFDVPLTSYRLRLTDGGPAGSEKYVWVTIPLRMDVDTGVQTPLPQPTSK
jgi:hypothetical protein